MADGGKTPDEDGERSLQALLTDIEALDALTADWPEEQQAAARARVQAVDDLNAEAFRRLIRTLRAVPGMMPALKDAATDELVYTVLRRHGILKASLQERVEDALESIRPMLASHGGDVELVSVDPPAVEVRFLGACDGCPASALTFYSGVKKAVQDAVPEITEVKQVKGLGGGSADSVHFTSPFAANRDAPWHEAATLDELADGDTLIREVAGRSVILSRFGDKVSVLDNACAHMGMAMDGGEIENGIITCPYHGFRYALDSGECLTAPEVALLPHGVRVTGNRIDVQLAD